MARRPGQGSSSGTIRVEEGTICVCGRATVARLVADAGVRHLVSCLPAAQAVATPPGVPPDRHLHLAMDDVEEETAGSEAPAERHIRDLLAFLDGWDRRAPLLVHCLAGVSRSPAVALVALAHLNPAESEERLAGHLRNASSQAWPNRRIVALGDRVLGRGGRLVAALERIGPGAIDGAASQFRLPVRLPERG